MLQIFDLTSQMQYIFQKQFFVRNTVHTKDTTPDHAFRSYHLWYKTTHVRFINNFSPRRLYKTVTPKCLLKVSKHPVESIINRLYHYNKDYNLKQSIQFIFLKMATFSPIYIYNVSPLLRDSTYLLILLNITKYLYPSGKCRKRKEK